MPTLSSCKKTTMIVFWTVIVFTPNVREALQENVHVRKDVAIKQKREFNSCFL